MIKIKYASGIGILKSAVVAILKKVYFSHGLFFFQTCMKINVSKYKVININEAILST